MARPDKRPSLRAPVSGVQTVGVVGAGTMGAGIAQAFGEAGFSVILHDTAPAALDRARGVIESSANRLVEKGSLTATDRDRALENVQPTTSFQAMAGADFLIEAIAEDRAAKVDLFRRLDTMARPDVVLASNTSSISIRLLAAATSRPDRVLGMHFMNPVPLMPLVELIRTRETSDQTMATAQELCQAIGKTSVVAGDSPGFLTNRILMPMINEAVCALRDGVGTADAIDAVMTLGMRHPMGPLRLADLIGLDVCLAILGELESELADPKFRACPLLRDKVARGELGRKTGHGFYEYTS